MKRVVVLGGYGNFGKRICEHLCKLPDVEIIIAGRNLSSANALAGHLNAIATTRPLGARLDIFSPTFADGLRHLAPFLVIHTGGPFQGQDYRVPLACTDVGAHYIDLADDRQFVCNITTLHNVARSANVQLISGASSVPGLSSAVIQHYRSEFTELDSVDTVIAPGNQAERGMATLRGILSYTGRPFFAFDSGTWRPRFGWMNPRRKDFGAAIGARWLANVDVPDLELFPEAFNVQQRVSFQASLELPLLHFTMVGMAWFSRLRVVRNWAPLTSLIYRLGQGFRRFGSGDGAMQVELMGKDHQHRDLAIQWQLDAYEGIGPHIPTVPALIIAHQLLRSDRVESGAFPCVSRFRLEDFHPFAQELGLVITENRAHG